MNVIFMGTPDFSVPVLERLIEDGYSVVAVVTQPDRPKGRKRVLTPPPVKEAAIKHDIPVLQPEKISDPKQLQEVLAYEPDLVVTAAFGQLLPNELLDSPRFGCINVHASLLPKYRGGAPIHQAIIDGETESGITIMYMVEKLDAGDILTQVSVPITETDHVGTLHDKLSIAGAQLLSETIPTLVKGELTPIKQDDSQATFASNIKREQERIDWSVTGEDIYNHIRGLHPWPVAFTTLHDGTVMKVWWGEKVQVQEQAQPGTILAIETDGIVVATGNETAIKLTDIQLAGKKRMLVEQFLRGSSGQLEVGQRLGEANEER